jgi:hypothetical protein
MSLFCCTISSYKLGFDFDQNSKLIEIFENKIKDKSSNILYKVSFYVMKNI